MAPPLPPPPPPPPDQSSAGHSNYQHQGGGRFGGRSFGRGGRGRGRFDDRGGAARGGRGRGRYDDRGGGRSFAEGRGFQQQEGRGFQQEGRGFQQEGRGFQQEGRGFQQQEGSGYHQESRGGRGRGFYRGGRGRFPNSDTAPTTGRARGRHYEGRGRGRGRFRGRGRDQWTGSAPLTEFSPAGRGETFAGRGELDWAGRERDWNTKSPDMGSVASGGDLEWGNPVEALEQGGNLGGTIGGQFDSENRGGSSDWAGRDREWHNSSPAGQSIPVGRRASGAMLVQQSRRDWNNRSGNLEDVRGAPNEFPGVPPRAIMSPPPPPLPPVSERASSGHIPFADEGDYTTKRKRGESPVNMGGLPPPFEIRRQPSFEGSEMYTSPAQGQFRVHNPPPQGGDGSPYGQNFPGLPREQWTGGRGRGSMQSKIRTGRGDFAGRGDFVGRSDFSHHAGRGPPPQAFHDAPPPTQFHDGQPFPGAPPLPPGSPILDRDTAESTGHYGPQPLEFSRTAAPGRPPLPPGEGPSGGGFHRYQIRDGLSFHSAPPPPPPQQNHVPPPIHMPPRRESDSSASWNRQPPLRESVSTGSYASLAESGLSSSAPFIDESTRGEPRIRLPTPPVSDTRIAARDSTEPETLPYKPCTPIPTPVEEKAVVEAPKSPPLPVCPPSGLMVALTRLADLESQLDFALAKHKHLARQRELLEVQAEHLKTLPVGVEAFQDELAKLVEKDKEVFVSAAGV